MNRVQANREATIDITSRGFKANPFPFYARLREESPVYRTILPDKQAAYLITRYDDVMMVLKDEDHFVKNPRNAKTPEQLAKMPWMPPMFKPLTQNLLDNDWDVHTRLRGLVHKAFTPRLVENMRERVQGLANELLDSAARKGHMELMHDYALPIPLTIISEILGVDPKDRDRFQKRLKTALAIVTKGHLISGTFATMGITRFLRRTIKERRANPKDDLISLLVKAEEVGEKLNEDELLAMVFVLLTAGHETTLNLIGSGVLALLENRDQAALLRQKPELAKNAVEELLRFVSPVEQATERYAREEITLHGVTIPKGEMVLAVLASANRDERQFPNGDKLDITRENLKHVALGQGVHFCVGAPLARIEGQIAITTLVQRFPNLRLNAAPETLSWRPMMTVRGLEALPVAL